MYQFNDGTHLIKEISLVIYKWHLPCLMIYTNHVSMVKTMQATRKIIKIIVTEIIVTEICSNFRR